ncbi:MAG: hypothetical protein JO144_15430, partial [Actinobacteria bacterium]|nr:hypothetical protein [Actinomycetota bacterium]
AAAVGAAIWYIGRVFGTRSTGSAAGALVEFAILLVLSVGIYLRARRRPVGAHNVNDDWEGSRTEAEPHYASGGVG